jgi:Lysylphosphatidylglycerol synthase TM region
LLLAVLIGLISWSGECGALYFVFTGLGVAPGLALLIKATFILAFSSLVGSASGLPGGLGVAEGSVLGLTRLLISPSAALGGAATLLIRFCTLWFGLALGIIALLIFQSTQRTPLFGQPNDRQEEQEGSDGPQPTEAALQQGAQEEGRPAALSRLPPEAAQEKRDLKSYQTVSMSTNTGDMLL